MLVRVLVGVTRGVLVGVFVGALGGVPVGVFVGALGGVPVGVFVGAFGGVPVGVFVGVGVATITPDSENAPLKAPEPTISVPTRSQSGSRFALRIQACRSGVNGVPDTIGRGADSQKKLPVLSWTCGMKK